MKVEICKSVDIETEVDITLEDIANEISARLEKMQGAEERGESWRYFTTMLADAVSIIKRVPDSIIAQVPEPTRSAIANVLSVQHGRWRSGDRMVWILGQCVGDDWEFQGVFDTESQAVSACQNNRYFVAPAVMNDSLPAHTIEWEGAYFPLGIRNSGSVETSDAGRHDAD